MTTAVTGPLRRLLGRRFSVEEFLGLRMPAAILALTRGSDATFS